MSTLTESEIWIYFDSSDFDDELSETLKNQYNIDPMDAEDVFTSSQLSKIERRKEYVYVALHFPELDQQNGFFVGKEVHIFINKEYILVLNKHDLKHALDFHHNRDILLSDCDTTNTFYFFYELLDYCVVNEYAILHKFKVEIDKLSTIIFSRQHKRDEIVSVQKLKRNLVDFISLIEPVGEVIIDLQTRYHDSVDTDGLEKLDDSLDKIKKIQNNLRNFQSQVDIISETNEALTARSTDKSIRRLTVVNVILLIPNIITSFFGMNVFFGWDGNNFTPLISILIVILASTFVVLWLIKKSDFFQV